MDNDEEGMLMLSAHIRVLLAELRKQDPDGTHSPFAKSDIKTFYRLPSIHDWGKIDYEEWLLSDLGYETEVRFLKRGGSDNTECDGRVGSVMLRESNSRRSFLEKLGYLRRTDLYDYVSIALIGLDAMREYLDGDYRAVCEFEIIETVPPWYNQILDTM
jgi:hypothetical protein